MSITVQIVGDKKVVELLGKANKTALRALLRGTYKAGLLVQKEARTSVMKSPKEGREYFNSARGKKTRASLPGNPPANQTGELVRNITVTSKSITDGVSQAVVSAGTEYAAPLEYGTRDIEARPFMRPALENNAKQIAELVHEEIRVAVAGVQ